MHLLMEKQKNISKTDDNYSGFIYDACIICLKRESMCVTTMYVDACVGAWSHMTRRVSHKSCPLQYVKTIEIWAAYFGTLTFAMLFASFSQTKKKKVKKKSGLKFGMHSSDLGLRRNSLKIICK